eukprot:TRINITY_DN5817_c0_g1_i2.p1 TRINITY_DN5817_c0_g1~~TRINITY_DN5817_c0_g1_i2.p1  ORF type:complete len:279 (-),score=79.15 TRINITY_DN5817_c0_g1_i2:51-887(-)
MYGGFNIFCKVLRLEEKLKTGGHPGALQRNTSTGSLLGPTTPAACLTPPPNSARGESKSSLSMPQAAVPSGSLTPSISRHGLTSPRGSRSRSSSKTDYSSEELKMFDQLEKETHFSSKELKTMFSKFKKEAPTLLIDRAGFALVTQGMGIKEKFLQDAIFNKFDTDRSGSIDFSEFVKGMSVMTRGTAEEKLEAAFRMYDLDGSGSISREEFLKIMESFKHLQGGEVTVKGQTYKDITQLCTSLFDEIDADHSGELSLVEYKAGALKHAELMHSFGII